MSNLKTHAEYELSLIGGEDDELQKSMNDNILKIVDVFSEAGHSGFSASYARGIIEKLLDFKPLSPLTGEDDEWVDVGDGLFQNKRCSRVFKEDGKAFDISGKVFIDKDGSSWTNSESRIPVTFPYTPKIEYVKDSTNEK